MKYRIRLLFILLMLQILLATWAFFHMVQTKWDSDHPFYRVLLLAFCMSFALFFYVLYLILRSIRLSRQVAKLEQEQRFHSQKEHDLQLIQNNARRYQSGILPELAKLKELLSDRDGTAAIAKIHALTEHFENTRMHPVCSDSLLNTILQVKKESAKEHGINVNYQLLLPDSLRIPNTVLSCIFFNLLDNGIEACQKGGSKEPFIYLSVKERANFLSIYMENSKNPEEWFDGTTTKENEEQHGLGLSIIEELVHEYEGSCEWEDKREVFCSRLMIRTDMQKENLWLR